MIITRSPLRISVGGGGTDLPSFYEGHGTTFSSLAISRYVYTSVSQRFFDRILIKYLQNEEVDNLDDIKNDLFREIIRFVSGDIKSLEISTFSEVPGGTGLGSSGSFSCALILSLFELQKKQIGVARIAELATHIEKDILLRPIGLQDQYISAYGGFHEFCVTKSGVVQPRRIQLSEFAKNKIERNWQLFFLGATRSSSVSLETEGKALSSKPDIVSPDGAALVELGKEFTNFVKLGDLDACGRIIQDQFERKLERQKGLTDSVVFDAKATALKYNALGCKLVGAGGTGFLLVLSENPEDISREFDTRGYKELTFSVSETGTETLLNT